MCGRYYVDDETAREIEKLVETVNDKLRLERLRKERIFIPQMRRRFWWRETGK